MRALALVAFLAVCPGLAVAADEPAEPPSPQSSGQVPPGLAALLGKPEHRRELLAVAQSVEKSIGQPCTAGNYVTTGQVGVLVPYREDSAGKPIAGAWKEAINETGCGAPRLLNALTVVQADGRLVSHPLLPGTTITDPELQRDSVQYAAAGMGAMPPGCDQGSVVDTAYVGLLGEPPGTRPQVGGDPHAWIERWTLQACSKRVTVAMKFTPDATGTAIEASPVAP